MLCYSKYCVIEMILEHITIIKDVIEMLFIVGFSSVLVITEMLAVGQSRWITGGCMKATNKNDPLQPIHVREFIFPQNKNMKYVCFYCQCSIPYIIQEIMPKMYLPTANCIEFAEIYFKFVVLGNYFYVYSLSIENTYYYFICFWCFIHMLYNSATFWSSCLNVYTFFKLALLAEF